MPFTIDFLNNLKNSVSLVDLVRQDTELRKDGSIYKGRCPLAKSRHEDREDSDASFTVYPADNKTKYDNFYCYGCHIGNKKESGYGSDIFEYIRLRDGVQFKEAVEKIALIAGVDIPKKKESKIKKDLYSQVLAQNRSYWTELMSNKEALNYLEDRGLTSETIDKFRLGIVPEDTKFQPIRGRLAIPIIDMSGRACGFGFRTLKEDHPKYLNSPNSDIFKKSNLWFGLHQARSSIVSNDSVIFVEGYFDAMLLHQYGVKNAIAGMGVAINNLECIKRYTSNAIVWTDGDSAGKKAAIRYINALKEAGFSVKVVESSVAASDPADIALENKENTLEYINNNLVYWTQYKLSAIMSKLKTKIIDARAQALPEILEVLSEVSEQSMLDFYISLIKDTLEIDYSTIMSKLTKSKISKDK